MSNHFYYDYPFIMSNLTKSEYSFIMGSLLLRVTSSIMGPSLSIQIIDKIRKKWRIVKMGEKRF